MKNDLRIKHQITLHRKKTLMPSKLLMESQKACKLKGNPKLKRWVIKKEETSKGEDEDSASDIKTTMRQWRVSVNKRFEVQDEA